MLRFGVGRHWKGASVVQSRLAKVNLFIFLLLCAPAGQVADRVKHFGYALFEYAFRSVGERAADIARHHVPCVWRSLEALPPTDRRRISNALTPVFDLDRFKAID